MLDSKQVTTQVSWDSAQHPLPAGTANPSNTVSSSYTWNSGARTLATETVQPGVVRQQRVTAYTYNAHGLPTGAAVTASGDPEGTRSTGTAYSADGYFPQVVTNALGHNASTQVRARDGQPTLVTDANGLRTLVDYDAFGVATRKRFRGATDAVYVAPDQHMAVSDCVLSVTCWRPLEQYQVTTVQDGAPPRIQRFDALGRVSVDAELQMHGVWTHLSISEYDALGRLSWRTEPLRSGDASVWTTFFYDTLGRMTQKIVPKQGEDGRGDMVTTYAYSGRTTSIQVCGSNDGGAGCLNLSRTTDSLGRYVETVDAKAGRTRFWYESNGNVAAIEDAKGVVTRASYNAIGQRASVDDPNQGHWSFLYNGLGEVTGQTDARGIVTDMQYDKLGRPRGRAAWVDVTGDGTADHVQDSWTYDPVNAIGAPKAAMRQINAATERWTGYSYDTLARPVQTNVVQALASGTGGYQLRTKYDSYYGRPIGQEFPNGEAVQVLYGNYGHALAEKDPLSGIEYRRLNSVNARNQPVQETFGNGVVLNAQYQHQTGQLTQLHYTKGAADVRKLGYGYDVFGNVRRQSLNDGASREDYAYDELQRMVSAIRSGGASGSIGYGYDSVGNLTKKTDFSANTANAYSYTGGSCGGGANAVRSVALAAGGTRTYCYDANGSLVGDNAGLALQYDHQGMTVKATRGAQTDHFRYGPDGARTRSWGSDGARVYLPGYEHRTDTGETKVYVGDYAVISKTGATRKVDYLLKDRLGSVDAVTDSAGTVTETRGYDAFGKPRSGTWNDLTPPKLGSVAITPKGFTQHEHLNQLELIHMNGRVFDYALGRFFSVDPIIQFPLNSQSLNPYSYILNNPLSGTDPTGYAAHLEGRGDGCNGMQSCELGKNKLNSLASEVQSMAKGGMSTSDLAGKKFGYALNQVATKGEKYNAVHDRSSVAGLENGASGKHTPWATRKGGLLHEAYAPQRDVAFAAENSGNAGSAEQVGPSVVTHKNGEGRANWGILSNSEHVFPGVKVMAHRISDGEILARYDEDGDGDFHCAELIKHRDVFGAPNAQTFWRSGRPITPGMNILPGTAIATFDQNGRYRPVNGAMHAAIFVAFSPDGDGIYVVDQWHENNDKLRYRRLQWQYVSDSEHARRVNSASNFSTIIW